MHTLTNENNGRFVLELEKKQMSTTFQSAMRSPRGSNKVPKNVRFKEETEQIDRIAEETYQPIELFGGERIETLN